MDHGFERRHEGQYPAVRRGTRCIGNNMAPRLLTALPVYNEASHIGPVLDEVKQYADDVLVVDDGSTDGSSEILAKRDDIFLVSHERNGGYGSSLKTAFDYAIE